MTSLNGNPQAFNLVRAGGVVCKSDMGLVEMGRYSNELLFLSFYGSVQQVRALFSLFATGHELKIVSRDGEEFSATKRFGAESRQKTFSLGYGKRHSLIYTADLHKEAVIWLSPEERLDCFRLALMKRRIPFDLEWLPDLEALLLEEDYLKELSGWGGIGGYRCSWQDDEICNLIVEKILPGWRDKNGVKGVHRKVWTEADGMHREQYALRL